MKKDSFVFWQKWLVVAGVVSIGVGILLMAPPLFDTEFAYINTAFWESGQVPADARAFYNWMFGLYAAMEVAWALFIIFVACYPFKKKEKWAWTCLASCISVWFIIDSGFSIAARFYVNAFDNLFFYLMLMLPLMFTKKYFA